MSEFGANSSIPFIAYKGTEPYMFISYAHVDSAQVYPIIMRFTRQGYNVWYDEGIEPGIEWPEEIAKALNASRLFVVFITPNSVASENVRNEINFALAHKLPFIAIFLCETTLTPGLQLQIGSKQAIMHYQMDGNSFERKYRYSFDTIFKPGVNPPEKPAAPVALSPAGDEKAPAQAPPPAQSKPLQPAAGAIPFKLDIIRQAACAEIGLPLDRQLEAKHCAAVTKLKIFADAFGEDCLGYDKTRQRIIVRRRGQSPTFFFEAGKITELSDFKNFPALKELILPYHTFSDLAPLAGLPIKDLDLSCNKLADLAPLAELRHLTGLWLDFAEYPSLLPLDNCNNLFRLFHNAISPQAFRELCTLHLPQLNYLTISESKLETLAGLASLQSLTMLSISKCTIFEFDELARLPKLDILYMWGTKCHDFSFLEKMPKLTQLYVDDEGRAQIKEMYGENPLFLK